MKSCTFCSATIGPAEDQVDHHDMLRFREKDVCAPCAHKLAALIGLTKGEDQT